jgi:LmbE family N-acetylglucosaminyl deacetylase
MDFFKPTAELYVPEYFPRDAPLLKVTHLAIGAHQDDIEIMAFDGLLKCWNQPDKGFAAVVVTDGAGSPRDGVYANYTDMEMRQVRRREQKKAAYVGEYRGMFFLDYSSSEIKNSANTSSVEDLKSVLLATRPRVVYTHNLADKHDTHVSVALRTIAALRSLPPDQRPGELYGCEVWRNLDWMMDEEKVVFALNKHENLAMSLVGIFDSQIAGGKRYDLATQGRRQANATYAQSHATDTSLQASYAMDLTPLIQDDQLDIRQFAEDHIKRFAADVSARLTKFS